MKLSSLITQLIVAAAVFGLGYYLPKDMQKESENTDKPRRGATMYDFEKENIRKAVQDYQSLPPRIKAALVGCRLGLLFTTEGTSAFDADESYNGHERIQYYTARDNALLIDFEGRTYSFHSIIEERNKTPGAQEKWSNIMQVIGGTTDANFFAQLGEDVSKLAQEAAKYHLKNLSQQKQDAWLAYQMRLLFRENGDSIFTGRVYRHQIPGTHSELVFRQVTGDTCFVDSTGNILYFNPIRDQIDSSPKELGIWRYAATCAALLKPREIAALFPEKMKTMRPSKK